MLINNFQLTSLLAEIGLNIQEAHAFSTVDGFSLDVFVVDGWLCEVLSYSFHRLKNQVTFILWYQLIIVKIFFNVYYS